MIWIIVLIVGLVVLSVLIGVGINLAFIKILLMFAVGFFVVISLKKLWDNFKG